MYHTKCDCIHSIELTDIRNFLISYRTKNDGNQRSNDSWSEGVAIVYDFLAKYYVYNKDCFDFCYSQDDLFVYHKLRTDSRRRVNIVKKINYLGVKSPRSRVKKNRLLLYGYLDLILFECEKYDPDITLGVALQAYAGLREGEVVNVSYDRIKLRYGGFGTISDIEINLESPASFADKTRKSGFGSIKIPRKQLVYPDFTQDLMNRLGEHSSRMESMGYAVTGENPILLDKWGHPMSVHTYTNRVKRLFRAVWPGYNDLATKYPDLAMQWHPTQNGELKATEVTSNSHRKVWWLLPYDDPETGKHFDFEWEATIANRRYGNGCPYLSNQAVWPGYNDLETKDPELAKQWHPTKNGELKPTEITTKSPRKIWWYLPYDDPKTGKHFDFEWCISVGHRTRGHECPYLSGQAVWIGFNDLASNYPELAMQWHPTKNGKLTPDAFTSKSEKSVWWYLPYDDPETGKHFDFEWKEKICNRANGKGCPYLRGNKVWCGFNDLATCYPDVAVEWHFEKNRKMTPNSVHKHSSRKVWWNCQKCGNVWRTSVVSRTLMGSRCGRCGKTSDIKDNTC